jgi:hypothetical protein
MDPQMESAIERELLLLMNWADWESVRTQNSPVYFKHSDMPDST